MQHITRKAVRPSDSEEHVKFRSIQADGYKEGRRDRFWESFDPQGWLLQTLNYKNDYVTGEFRSFHSFGQVKEKGNYKEGKQEGLWEYFNENNTLERTETYKNGVVVE